MLRLGLVLLTLVILSVASVAFGRRRRRRIGELRLGRLPAGLRHLASQVGAASTFEMGLSLPDPGAARRRIGTLIGVR